MTVRILLGVVIGIVVSGLSWRGNQTPHGVSIFPDFATALALLILTCGAVWLAVRLSPEPDPRGIWKAGMTIATVAGVVFGFGLAYIGVHQFSRFSLGLSTFGLVIALVSALMCGAIACTVAVRLLHRGRDHNAV